MKFRNKIMAVFGFSTLIFGSRELFCPRLPIPYRNPFRFSKPNNINRFSSLKGLVKELKVSLPRLHEISPSHMEIYYGDRDFSSVEKTIPQDVRPKAEVCNDLLSKIKLANESINILCDGEMPEVLAQLLLYKAQNNTNLKVTLFMHRRAFCKRDINYQENPYFINLYQLDNVEVWIFGNPQDDGNDYPEMVMAYNYFVFSIDSDKTVYSSSSNEISRMSDRYSAESYFEYCKKNSDIFSKAPYLGSDE